PPPWRGCSARVSRTRWRVTVGSLIVTSADQPAGSSRIATASRSVEGNDEERLSVLYGRPARDEDVLDLAVGGRADLGDVAERLDAAQHVATRDGIAGRPLARRAEHAHRRGVDPLRADLALRWGGTPHTPPFAAAAAAIATKGDSARHPHRQTVGLDLHRRRRGPLHPPIPVI